MTYKSQIKRFLSQEFRFSSHGFLIQFETVLFFPSTDYKIAELDQEKNVISIKSKPFSLPRTPNHNLSKRIINDLIELSTQAGLAIKRF